MSTIPLFEVPEPAEEPVSESSTQRHGTGSATGSGERPLRLVDGAVPGTPDWVLTQRERRLGRRGVAQARAALRRAHPVEARHPFADELAG